jgi:hypothetical protein
MVALSSALPEGCGRRFGASKPQPATSVEPLPLPLTSATTPPVWAPPDTGGLPAPPPNADLAKARALAQAGDSKKVRALLEKKVKAGKGSKEEAALLLQACIALRDKACVDAVKAKHPEVDGL